MDYKYIEQLIERYWAAETSLEEERILHAFFQQQELPDALEPYRALFAQEAEAPLGDDFDARILALTEQQPQAVKARVVTLRQRMMPLFKAAAIVAIVLTLGNAAQTPWDASWNDPRIEYAAGYRQHQLDSADVNPIQAEYIIDVPADSGMVMQDALPKN